LPLVKFAHDLSFIGKEGDTHHGTPHGPHLALAGEDDLGLFDHFLVPRRLGNVLARRQPGIIQRLDDTDGNTAPPGALVLARRGHPGLDPAENSVDVLGNLYIYGQPLGVGARQVQQAPGGIGKGIDPREIERRPSNLRVRAQAGIYGTHKKRDILRA
jgi:hypothetical protein